MARIATEVIERLKSDVSLLRLIESQGHEPVKQGKDYVMCCPFHDDKTPSLIISPQSNLWHCMGACQKGGSVIDWVMQTQGVSFRFACEILQKDLSLTVDDGTKVPIKNTTTKLDSPLAADADSQTALRQVIDYYHETLKQSPEAQEYLGSRGLDDSELIDEFTLGFANRTLCYRLPAKNRKAGAELRGKLQGIGILRESGHEHFNGSLVVPVMDEHGVISEVYGRKILGHRLRKGTAQHLYLPGPHEGVWNVQAMAASKEIILCEALIDAMTFWVHGFRNVTASYGTSGFTTSHLAAFKQYNIERVLIAYDRDEAGNQAADALAEKLIKAGIDCFRILLPKGMDVNEYALTMSPADKALGLVIRKAQWLGKGQPPVVTSAGVDVMQSELPKLRENPSPLIAIDSGIPEPTEASPVPQSPSPAVEAEIEGGDITMTFGERRYRVRGLEKNTALAQLKINLLVSAGDRLHVDSFDLYSARHRQGFVKQTAIELGVKENVIKTDLGKVLLTLEEQQDQQLKEILAPEDKTARLSEQEEQAALELLQDKHLLSRILDDFNRAGVVGEETNKLVGYLAGVSRKLDRPLAVIIQSTSAAGKSSLMDAILNLMPEEERVQYSAMTGQSLFYMGETNLKHKILAIAEEEGASNASYALKLLQSEGEITIASTGKDDSTGNLVTKEYRVEGPVMLFLTTTAIDIDEELMNRCMVLTVNESREQTSAIHAMQRSRQTLEGLLADEDKKEIIELHRNAQRLLKTLLVANPFANELTFLDDKTRTRRDHMKYLTLIRSIALLHQYQRPVRTINHKGKVLSYIDVIPEDIKTANRLAHDVLGRTLDELPPQTRQLLKRLDKLVGAECQQRSMARKDYRFSRRDIREATGWSDGQLKIHCSRLTDMEYLLVHRGGRGQSLVYELLYDGDPDSDGNHLMGLIDPEKLQYDDTMLGATAQKTGPSQAQVSPKLGGRLGAETLGIQGKSGNSSIVAEKSTVALEKLPTSYRRDSVAEATA